MLKKTFLLASLLLIAMSSAAQWAWHNPLQGDGHAKYTVQNQGWNEDGGNYCRLPLRAKEKVREPLWKLSRNSAGLQVRFLTDANDIKVKYKATGSYSMPHMPATGVSGVDLYRNADKGFCFGNYSFGDTISYEFHIDRPATPGKKEEYTLYLPLYNTVEKMEIGVPEGKSFEFVEADKRRPIVLYGTSIAQGACSSRPGMAWANIVGRMLERPLVNLGFSGNGKLEPEVIDFINEQDACVYVVDCMPNLADTDAEKVRQLVLNAVRQIRKKHDAPILLVEHAGYSNGPTNQYRHDAYTHANEAQAKAYGELKREGVKQLYYLSREEIGLVPDAWVDYVHPSDLGQQAQAKAVAKKLGEILK